MTDKIKESLKTLPNYRGEVSSKNAIRMLPNVAVNEIFWVDMDKKPYVVAERTAKNIVLKPLDETATFSTGITIYDMNHSIISKEPIFNWDDIEATADLDDKICDWFYNETSENKYYLFYGRDIHYLTLIRKDGGIRNPLETLKEMIEAIGDLISMDFNTDSDEEKKIEVWVRTEANPAELLYLFPFDAGIVDI